MGLFKGSQDVEENNRIAKFAGLGLFNGKGWQEEMIKIHISEYSRLKLTYDSDAMNAILGVFRAWEGLNDPVYQYLGVPLCRGNKGDFSKLVDVATSAFIGSLLPLKLRPPYARFTAP